MKAGEIKVDVLGAKYSLEIKMLRGILKGVGLSGDMRMKLS